MYLNKIATGEGAVPTPATREEMYLAKIAGEEVEVPTPATRVEMYLYKIGGGEIIIPTPATRLEMFLAAASGMPVSTPVPATREEILWDYIVNGTNPQTITGVPPISFTGNGKPLKSVDIFGNTQQTGTPTPDAPIMPDFCGKLVGTDWTIPIANADQTVPVNLGEVPTVRRTKKLVLNGTEAWTLWNGNYYSSVIDRKGLIKTILCTHFINSGSQGISYSQDSASGLRIASVAVPFVSSVNDLKAWLAAQYANGTPVTIWYVLAEPETAIVNEPLAKIGDYADELHSTDAAVTIPTVKGSNELTVDTPIQPSEMSITGYIAESQTMTAAKIMARASGMDVNDKELESLSKKELNSILKGTVKSDGRSTRSNE
jgi:hypothetical protein